MRTCESADKEKPRSRLPSGTLICALLAALPSTVSAQDLPVTFDAKRSFVYLQQICQIGRRVSGSPGMERQQRKLIEHFRKFGCQISAQSFDVPHPVNGTPVRMTNLVVSFNPRAKNRVLLCCHYDTRPYPDRDRRNPRGVFVGANDGASGVALLMELGHHIRNIRPRYGVDFVFFDGEELVYRENDKFFHGSEYFAKWYRNNPPPYRYVCGVLVDMVGDKNLNLPMEQNSLRYAEDVTRSIWAVAKRMRVREFQSRAKFEVRDDHLPLNQIAKIPTCDIIDFDYPHWHTTRDVPSSCSAASLSKVGRVLLQWLTEVPIEPPR